MFFFFFFPPPMNTYFINELWGYKCGFKNTSSFGLGYYAVRTVLGGDVEFVLGLGFTSLFNQESHQTFFEGKVFFAVSCWSPFSLLQRSSAFIKIIWLFHLWVVCFIKSDKISEMYVSPSSCLNFGCHLPFFFASLPILLGSIKIAGYRQ